MNMRALFVGAGLCLWLAAPAAAQNGKSDKDDNGYADAGVMVTRHWNSLYAYDASGNWFWDLGDGRVQGTVASVEDLDSSTLSQCVYVNNSRGDFMNNPYQDTGWIMNNIRCFGYDGRAVYHYLIVQQSDPRYAVDADWDVWGTWVYAVLTESGSGNLVRK